jgi:hypothetical protein
MRTQEGRYRMPLGRALSRPRPSEARAELDRALALIGDDYLAIAPRIHEALADLAEMHGRQQEHERRLHQALGVYERIGATGHARRLRERLVSRAATGVE